MITGYKLILKGRSINDTYLEVSSEPKGIYVEPNEWTVDELIAVLRDAAKAFGG